MMKFSLNIGSLIQRLRSTEMSVMDDDDFIDMLKELNKLNDFKEKKLKCLCCDEILTSDNLAGFIYSEGEYKFVCNNEECLAKVKLREHN